MQFKNRKILLVPDDDLQSIIVHTLISVVKGLEVEDDLYSVRLTTLGDGGVWKYFQARQFMEIVSHFPGRSEQERIKYRCFMFDAEEKTFNILSYRVERGVLLLGGNIGGELGEKLIIGGSGLGFIRDVIFGRNSQHFLIKLESNH